MSVNLYQSSDFNGQFKMKIRNSPHLSI